MLKFYQRLNSFCAIVLFSCLLVLIGCSHKIPYYSRTVPDAQKGDVEVDPAAIKYRIILIGDAGDPKKGEVEPVLKTLGEWAKKLPKRTSIVFLGDNMYSNGLIEDNRGEVYCRLGPQLGAVIENQACGLFIPGNHDWDKGGKHGYSAVMAQEDFINKHLGAQSQCGHPAFLPEEGKPGPRRLELPTTAPVVRLVVLDTQWWLHKEHYKPPENPKAVIAELKTQLMTELPVIVVGHHPIKTHGSHGGFRDWQAHLFALVDWKKWCWLPTPILGSLYHFIDWHFRLSEQDTNGKDYKYMINQLNEAFSVSGKTSLLIYAAGHDHSLQVLKGNSTDYLLVSGAGSSNKLSGVTDGDNTSFAHEYTGFMVVDFLENSHVLLRVVEPDAKGIHFHQWLKR